MHPPLSFEQAPPISVPFRFMLTAPWFAVAAGLLLVYTGPESFASRWVPGGLAITHLLVAGFMLQAMSGALLQFVPVAAGGNIWRPRAVAGIVHPVLSLAVPMLAAGFLSGSGLWLRLAAAMFLAAIIPFIIVVGAALLATPARGATVRTLRLAVGGLLPTVLLGAGLAEGLAGSHSWPLANMVDIHAAWGLGAWSLMLLVGVSYFVVPMFQLTPPYPRRFADTFPIVLLLVVLAVSLQWLDVGAAWNWAIWTGGAILAAIYGAVTLFLQFRRRRRVTDVTLALFRFAMGCCLAILLTVLVSAFAPVLRGEPRLFWWYGVLVVPGVFMSAIIGMLYKVVPFLNWLHLQRLMGPGTLPPSMRDMIPEPTMRRQMRLHLAAVGLLLVAVVWPALVRPAGVAFACSSAWLGWNLLAAVRFYNRFKADIPAVAANRAG